MTLKDEKQNAKRLEKGEEGFLFCFVFSRRQEVSSWLPRPFGLFFCLTASYIEVICAPSPDCLPISYPRFFPLPHLTVTSGGH